VVPIHPAAIDLVVTVDLVGADWANGAAIVLVTRGRRRGTALDAVCIVTALTGRVFGGA
jgi:hypothetical protein